MRRTTTTTTTTTAATEEVLPTLIDVTPTGIVAPVVPVVPVPAAPLSPTASLRERSRLALEDDSEATGGSPRPALKDISSMKNTATCQVCFSLFSIGGKHAPMSLPCGHTWCRACLRKIKSTDGFVRCPIDRKVARKGIRNFALESMLTATGLCKVAGETESQEADAEDKEEGDDAAAATGGGGGGGEGEDANEDEESFPPGMAHGLPPGMAAMFDGIMRSIAMSGILEGGESISAEGGTRASRGGGGGGGSSGSRGVPSGVIPMGSFPIGPGVGISFGMMPPGWGERLHCEHCRGGYGDCACDEDCPRPARAVCIPSGPSQHCNHCRGMTGGCACREHPVCARKPVTQCRPRNKSKSSTSASAAAAAAAATSSSTASSSSKRRTGTGTSASASATTTATTTTSTSGSSSRARPSSHLSSVLLYDGVIGSSSTSGRKTQQSTMGSHFPPQQSSGSSTIRGPILRTTQTVIEEIDLTGDDPDEVEVEKMAEEAAEEEVEEEEEEEEPEPSSRRIGSKSKASSKTKSKGGSSGSSKKSKKK